MQETQIQSLGREDPLEKEMATCSSILGWKIPWTEVVDYFHGGHGVTKIWTRPSDETAMTAHFTTQDTEAQRNKANWQRPSLPLSRWKADHRLSGSCSLGLSHNQVLPLEDHHGPIWSPVSGASGLSRQSLSQISDHQSHLSMQHNATCASLERLLQTLDSATSPQTGCETSGDKIYFYFQEAICLLSSLEMWPELENSKQIFEDGVQSG